MSGTRCAIAGQMRAEHRVQLSAQFILCGKTVVFASGAEITHAAPVVARWIDLEPNKAILSASSGVREGWISQM